MPMDCYAGGPLCIWNAMPVDCYVGGWTAVHVDCYASSGIAPRDLAAMGRPDISLMSQFNCIMIPLKVRIICHDGSLHTWVYHLSCGCFFSHKRA